MSKRESSSDQELSQSDEKKLEDQRFWPYLKIHSQIDFCPSDYFGPSPTAADYTASQDGHVPYPLSTTKSWSRAESGPFDWKQQARAQDGYVSYPVPLSTTKSWSRAESGPFDWKQQARAQEFKLSGEVEIFGKVGLHCYNLQKGTNLQFLAVHKCQSRITSIISYDITLEALDPMRNSSCQFETSARYAIENKECLSAIVTACGLIKPQNPDSEEKCGYNPFDKALVDDFFKGEMPDWMRDGALTGSNKLQYYEMKESEVEEEKEWLHLYAELALLSLPMSELKKVEDVNIKPFELGKIVVRTREDVESKKKVKAENAIFYISFKTCCGRDFNVIVRKTTDGMPQHFSLEVKCF